MRTLFVVAAVLFAGCAATKEIRRAPGTADDQESVRQFEQDFRPSDYDPEPVDSLYTGSVPDSSMRTDSLPPQHDTGPVPEEVSGYRVQVFSTTNIDSAKIRLAWFEGMFPDDLFYLGFDPPIYKIRAGNFQTRYEADRFARLLSEKGIQRAWSVPQRVLKNPPPPARRRR